MVLLQHRCLRLLRKQLEKRAYIGIKYNEDFRNKMIVDGISSVLQKKGYESICIMRDIDKE